MTEPEKKMSGILELLGFVVKSYKDREYIDRGDVIYSQASIGRYRPDFVLLWARISIEVDGKYWHRKAVNQIRDREKRIWFSEHGWSVITVSDWDVMNRPEQTSERILEYIFLLLCC